MQQIIMLPPQDLIPAHYNPRLADEERLNLVRLSLRKLGFLLPIFINANKEILSGHQRVRVAMELGVRAVPALIIPIATDKEKGFNILCNRATNDMDVHATEQSLKSMLNTAKLQSIAERLDDIKIDSNKFFRCCYAHTMNVKQLVLKNIEGFRRHTYNAVKCSFVLAERCP